MKVVFVSRMLNHHQKAFSENMKKLCEYYFVATEDTIGDGYQLSEEAEYVVHWYRDQEKDLVRKLVYDADVVIFGSDPKELVELRMNENKLSFIYCERFFKKGTWRRFIPTTHKKLDEKILRFKKKEMYVLCASAFLPYDLSLLKFPTEKCFKWGYFPKMKKYENIEQMISNKKPNSIIWVARLIALKHPEDVIKAAEKLKCLGYNFELNLIGDGPLKPKIEGLIKRKGLSNTVHVLGSMTPEQVREHMEKAEMFVFSSNRREGWGAVMNESMNSACVTVASSAPGAPPFLVDEGRSGFIYKYGDVDDLCDRLIYLLDNPNKRKEMCKNAYESITQQWNAQVGAERLIALSKALLDGQSTDLYQDGPCSKAEILKDNWRK